MMRRDIYAQLLTWRGSKNRKPLVLRGARQTGKTYILQEFGRAEYQNCHTFNFERDPRLGSFFKGDLDPRRILRDLALYSGVDIHPQTDLLIFDEIQECGEALNALKYFHEQAGDYHIASAGSLLGVRMSRPKSFPVGKVDFLDLYPLSFYEFLSAVGEERYREYLETLETIEPIPEALHAALIALLRRYYYVGGMPEAVRQHAEDPEGSDCRTIQRAILDAYTLDFAKHAPTTDIPKLSLVWESLPAQLTRENRKFMFSVVKAGARAREYENALTWLANARLIHRCTLVSTPKLPLSAHTDASSFKLYACDVGLLGALANLPCDAPSDDLSILTNYHGAFVENYAAQQLIALTGSALYYWRNVGREAEVDFVLQHRSGAVPLEVKAGINLRSKSLAFYLEKFAPDLAVRISLRNLKRDNRILNIPLYALPSLPRLLDLALQQKISSQSQS